MTIRTSCILMLLLLICFALTGCATSLTSTTDARAYEVGEVQAAIVYQASVHSNIIGGITNAVKSADDEFDKDSNEPISEESLRSWLDAAIIGALFRPGTGPELLLRTGVYDDFMEGIDVGFKTDMNILKFDAKVQWWESPDKRQAFSTSIGYGYHLDVGNKILSYVTLTDFSRSDIDVQFLYGYRMGEWLKLTVAPHFIFSRVSPDSKIPSWLYDRLPDNIKEYDPGQFFQTEWLQYYGVNTNIMIGYKYAFATIDFGMFYMNFTPEVIGQERNFNGGAFSVAGGISGHYKF